MRTDQIIISKWIQDNSRVLDLGCGNGELLHYLMQHKNVRGYGVEIGKENITACIQKGINILENDINKGLTNFKDHSIDMVIMSNALQTMRSPDKVVEEMLRIGQECIVAFPNFAHWRARFYLAFKGKMPVSKFLSYTWYNTPNIHFFTVKDFEELCHNRRITILDRTVVDHEHQHHWWTRIWPNMLGEIAIYRITRQG